MCLYFAYSSDFTHSEQELRLTAVQNRPMLCEITVPQCPPPCNTLVLKGKIIYKKNSWLRGNING